MHYFVLFLWGCFSHLPFSYRCKPLSNSTLRQPILQADVVQSKVEMREILAPVNVSKPVSLVSSAGNQVAPPDSYAMFRHLMEAKVIQRRKSAMNQTKNLSIMFQATLTKPLDHWTVTKLKVALKTLVETMVQGYSQYKQLNARIFFCIFIFSFRDTFASQVSLVVLFRRCRGDVDLWETRKVV